MASVRSRGSSNYPATHRTLSPKPHSNMSANTKCFIQKICNKDTASIDMTKNGFVKYASMMHPLSFILKPLKQELTKMLAASLQSKLEESTKSPIKHKLTHQRRKNSKVRGSNQPERKLVKKKKVKILIKKNIPNDKHKKTVKFNRHLDTYVKTTEVVPHS